MIPHPGLRCRALESINVIKETAMTRALLLMLPLALAACTHPTPESASPAQPSATAAASSASAASVDTTVLAGHHWQLTHAVTVRGEQRIDALFPGSDKP